MESGKTSTIAHALRVAAAIVLMLLIPSPKRLVEYQDGPPDLVLVQNVLPAAWSIDPQTDASGLWTIRDEAEESLAKVTRTLPIAADVVGYRGPAESLIVFDSQLAIKHVVLINSADTHEHVDAVVADDDFFAQFQGWPWGGPESNAEVDAVSGATLTSLALAEGVLKRIGGERPSLVFADAITQQEYDAWLDDGESKDQLIRSGPFSDDIAGYQGPTELLMKFRDDKLEKINLRFSFDNDLYVGYVQTEAGFWKLFKGKTLQELADFDPAANRVEGVSGATMTSLAVADTVPAAARAYLTKQADSQTVSQAASWMDVRWTTADLGTIGVLICLAVFSRMGLFRNRGVRRIWLFAVTIVIGLWAGNLVSMALIAGWSAEGIAWRLAPGLACITAVAIVFPPLTKGNPYCNHLCPHGAIQQLVRPGSKARRRFLFSPKWSRLLAWIPGVTLVAAYVMLVTNASTDLSSWEPFHAYLFRVAPWIAFAFALVSLGIAACVPMAYCRLGCPTGRLLDYIRRTANSAKWRLADTIVAILCGFAYWMRS